MDHDAQLSKMDPKLKEAYERVMGFNHTTGNHATPPVDAPQIPQPTPSPTEPVQVTQPTAPAEPTATNAPRLEAPLRRSMETVHFQTQPVITPKLTAQQIKTKKKTSPVIFFIGGVLFFAVYIVVWMKLLGVSIPFLP